MKIQLSMAILFLCFSLDTTWGQTVQEAPKAKQPAAPKEKDDQEKSAGDDKDSEESEKAAESDEQKKRSSSSSRSRRNNRIAFTKKSEDFVNVFTSVIASTRDSVVEITDGKKRVALGTVVGKDGLVLTKASELKGDLSCSLPNGDTATPTIVGIDPETDLVLLKLDVSDLAVAPFMDQELVPEVGSWIVTVSQDESPLSVGIVSHEPRKIRNNVPNSAVIGIYPRDRSDGEEGVRINQVLDETPAEKSGLLVNDVILKIDNEKIENVDKLRQKLSEYQPGDEIKLRILRNKEEKDVDLTLGRSRVNPMMDRGNRQNRMGSILSKRRSDFPLALQHDSSLNANECGGPVVDLSGKVVGVNIARDGRVSTLVLPNSIVLPVVARLSSGEYAPEIVNKEKIDRVEKQLAKLDTDVGDLPTQKSTKEIEFSAGSAIESEIKNQIDDLEKRLKSLKERHSQQKSDNRKISDGIAEIKRKLEANQNRREKLEFELKRLKTGVR